MKIKDFNTTPLGVKVRCGGRVYRLVDKIRDTHEAVMRITGKGSRKIIRCSEIELYHEAK